MKHILVFSSLVGFLACSVFAIVGPATTTAAPNNAPNPGQVKQVPLKAPSDLLVSARTIGYTLGSGCGYGGPAITFHVTVENAGVGGAGPISQSQGGVEANTAIMNGKNGSIWGGAAALPPMNPYQTMSVDVNVAPLSPASAMVGTWTFTVSVNNLKTDVETNYNNDSANVTVVIPKGFCANRMANPIQPMVKLATPSPSPSPSPKQSGMGVLGPKGPGTATQPNHYATTTQLTFAPVPLLPAPVNLTYTNDPVVCTAHIAGLGAALVCPGLMKSAVTLPLVWDWHACNGVGCVTQPDGYHIYQVTQAWQAGHMFHLGGNRLVDTQPDPTITIRGISPYEKTDCYVVTAYKGTQESAVSNEWCGASNLAMGMATLHLYPSTYETRDGIMPTACSPNETIAIETGVAEEGVDIAVRNRLGGVSECWATFVSHAYLGFNINAHGRIWKAILTVTGFSDNCAIIGVWKTLDTSWFNTSKYSMTPVFLGQSQATQYLPTDAGSERDFSTTSDKVMVGTSNWYMQDSATADITSWFPSGGLTSLGIGFRKNKYYNPTDSTQPDNNIKQIAENTAFCADPLAWSECVFYLSQGQLPVDNSSSHSNPPDTLTPCAYDFTQVWLDIQYYPNS